MNIFKNILIGAGIIGVIIIALGALTVVGPILVMLLLAGLQIAFYIIIIVVPIWIIGKVCTYFYNKHKLTKEA